MGSFLWLKSRNKVFTALLGAICDRPGALGDAAAMVRPHVDHTELRDGPIGHGTHQCLENGVQHGEGQAAGRRIRLVPGLFVCLYAPDPDNVHDSHSIYFEVLGEHGFVGLGLFLMLALMTWRTASWVIRRARRDREKRWAADLAAMMQVSLVGYASAGAFLGLAYFDYYYTLDRPGRSCARRC